MVHEAEIVVASRGGWRNACPAFGSRFLMRASLAPALRSQPVPELPARVSRGTLGYGELGTSSSFLAFSHSCADEHAPEAFLCIHRTLGMRSLRNQCGQSSTIDSPRTRIHERQPLSKDASRNRRRSLTWSWSLDLLLMFCGTWKVTNARGCVNTDIDCYRYMATNDKTLNLQFSDHDYIQISAVHRTSERYREYNTSYSPTHQRSIKMYQHTSRPLPRAYLIQRRPPLGGAQGHNRRAVRS